MIAERLLESRKRGLTGAVARRNVVDFEFIAEGRNDLLDVRIARHHEVEAAGDQVNVGVD